MKDGLEVDYSFAVPKLLGLEQHDSDTVLHQFKYILHLCGVTVDQQQEFIEFRDV